MLYALCSGGNLLFFFIMRGLKISPGFEECRHVDTPSQVYHTLRGHELKHNILENCVSFIAPLIFVVVFFVLRLQRY